MKTSAHDLSILALYLPQEDRLALATKLIDSVEGGVDPEWEDAWLQELARRRVGGTASAAPGSEPEYCGG